MLHNKSWRNSFFVSSVSYGLGSSILFVLQNACGGVSGDDHCEEVSTSIGWVSTCEPNTGLVLVLGIEKKNSYQDGPRLIFTWYEAGINLVCKASIASGHPSVVGSLIPVLVTILVPGTAPIDWYNTSHLHGHCKLCSCSMES